ncbi:MAG: 7-carboxy-7-deazaguanine synthase QueE [Candidatus Omnitrophica bacterium]|nr:7-carboxy-7-deazaguanine synthase QueE [Candidatus Omnitrophota bacterium]
MVDPSRVSEIFSSLQGEGTHLGERHLFIRFEECHIRCVYCDELEKEGEEMTRSEVMDRVHRLEADEGPHAFVALTGGEPLLYVVFLVPLIRQLKQENFRIYLETNGILWRALEAVIDDCNCIAMDMKPSSVTHERNFDFDHRKFLQIAQRTETFVKIAISHELDRAEFENQIRIVAEVAPGVPVILQPVTGVSNDGDIWKQMNSLEHLQRLGQRWHREIRIMPRFHKIFNLR